MRVIGTNVGGLPEVVTTGETGFLAPVGDVQAMGDAAGELLLDDDRWNRTSAAAAADARTRFSQAEIVRQYEDFYRYAIGRIPAGATRASGPTQTIATH